MTPETRAARDRITAYLDACDHRHPGINEIDTEIGPTEDENQWFERHLTVADLRTVLAALDHQPDQILVSDAALSPAQYEDLKQRFLAAQYDGTPIRVLDEPKRAPCAECGRPIQYIDHPGLPNGWMHIFEAHDHEARPLNPDDNEEQQ